MRRSVDVGRGALPGAMPLLALVIPLAVLYVAVGLATLTTFPLVWGDEGWYVQSAWAFLDEGRFTLPMLADFAGFDTDNVVYGRLYLAALSVAFALGDTTPFFARAVSFLSGLVALAALYGVGRELWSPRVGLLAVLLLAVSPVFVDQSHDARPEIMQLAVMLIAFYLLLRGLRLERPLWLVAAGLVASLAADVHLNGLIAPMALAAVMVVLSASPRSLALFIAGAAIGGVWWLFVHVLPDIELFFEQTRAFGRPSPLAALAERPLVALGVDLAQYLRVDLGSLLMLVAGLVAGAVLLWRHRDPPLLGLVTYGLLLVLFGLVVVGNDTPIYAVLVWPVLVLLIARLAAVVDRRAAAGLVTALVVASAASVGNMALRDRDADFDGYTSQLAAAIPPEATVVGTPTTWFGFVGRPYIMAQYFTFTDPLAAEMRRLGVDYLIADEYVSEILTHHLGQVSPEALESFLADHGQVVAEVEDPHYGRLQSRDDTMGGDPPFVTRVYRIEAAAPARSAGPIDRGSGG